MTLRPAVKASILNALEQSAVFVVTDFELTSENPQSGAKVRIGYRHGDAYFVAQFPNKQTRTEDGGVFHNIGLSFRPGRLNVVEAGAADGEHAMLSEIRDWLSRVHDDLKAGPVGRQIDEHERQLQDLYKRVGLEDDEPLDEETQQTLIERIRELEQKMADAIRQQSESEAIIKREIATLHAQVDALCVIIESQTSKKGAIRAVMGRIFGWSAKPQNQKLLKDVAQTVAGFLTDGTPGPG